MSEGNVLGDRIKAILEEQNKTQAELCRITNISRSTLSAIITGVRDNPNLDLIVSIAKALNVSLDYLAGITDKPSANLELKEIEKEYGISVKAMENIKKMYIPFESLYGYPFIGLPNETVQEYKKDLSNGNKHRYMALNALLESKKARDFFEALYNYLYYYKSAQGGAIVIPYNDDTEEIVCNTPVGDLFDNALPDGLYAIYDKSKIYDELLLKKVSDELITIKRKSDYTKNKLLDDKKRYEELINTTTDSILKRIYLDYIKEIDEQLKE